MYYVECGQKLPDGVNFCFKCGAKTINNSVGAQLTNPTKDNIIEELRQTNVPKDYVAQKAEEFVAEDTAMAFKNIRPNERLDYVAQKASFIENTETVKDTYSRTTPSISQSNLKDNKDLLEFIADLLNFIVVCIFGGASALLAGAIIDIIMIPLDISWHKLGVHLNYMIIVGAVIGAIVFLIKRKQLRYDNFPHLR